ncbi:hypothetical protein ACQP00_22990 [Dactylosporangium sp. CS-047395]|uniref:hypothetical protein n=1 Tax=Dactylosporangium sp. CS-047395 TaxID=3239936 RepID=UPI003D93ABCB
MQVNADQLVLLLAERDYLYGSGTLTLRVSAVERDAPITYDHELWYYVHGMQLGFDGREVGDRMVVVRGRRLVGTGALN